MPTYRAAEDPITVNLMRIAPRHGSGFAFPSRTVCMAHDAALAPRAER